MNIVIKLKDIAYLNLWINSVSKPGWLIMLAGGLAFAYFFMYPNSDHSSIYKDFLYLVLGTVVGAFFIAVLSLPFLILATLVNIFKKGALGNKTISFSSDHFIEKDKYKENLLAWDEVKAIIFTSKYILLKKNVWLYYIIPRRYFDNEYHYASYYSNLVKNWLKIT